jgi:5S rRNA maturation endonuclease (ribonuclease M5)
MYCVYQEYNEEIDEELTTSFDWFEEAEEFFRKIRRGNEGLIIFYESDKNGNKIRTIAQRTP